MARTASGEHQRPAKCKRCGVLRTDDRPISRRGNCRSCGRAVMAQSSEEQYHKRGEIWEKQLHGQIARAERDLAKLQA